MSIRFAGSRCVDERRRRRLAQEADVPASESKSSGTLDAVDSEDRTEYQEGDSPADSLITPKLWKHTVLALVVMALWGGMLFLGVRADASKGSISGLVGLKEGKLTTFFSTVMLLAAGQLSLINLWYRSRSRKDFSGSYKLWFYASIGWLICCAATASGAHITAAEAVLRAHPIAAWNIRSLLWLVPAAIMMLPLSKLLLREMRDCRGSCRWLKGAALLAGLWVATHLMGEHLLTSSQQLLSGAALATGWPMLLALSMLIHARHVIHVSNEAPKTPLTMNGGLLRALIGGIRRQMQADEADSSDVSDSEEMSEESEKPASRSTGRKTKTATTTRKKATTKRSTAKSTSKSGRGRSADAEEAEEKETTVDSPVNASASETAGLDAREQDEYADAIAAQYDTDLEEVELEVEEPVMSQSNASSANRSGQTRRFDEPQGIKAPLGKSRGANQLTNRSTDTVDNESDSDSYSDSEESGSERLDPAALRGLSKKERRALQRKHKESQRQR
ncbi:MAG: hypothetical protein R3C01_02535 [Planctomycetaceae bacterium]